MRALKYAVAVLWALCASSVMAYNLLSGVTPGTQKNIIRLFASTKNTGNLSLPQVEEIARATAKEWSEFSDSSLFITYEGLRDASCEQVRGDGSWLLCFDNNVTQQCKNFEASGCSFARWTFTGGPEVNLWSNMYYPLHGALHETGHALGLDHTPFGVQSVMGVVLSALQAEDGNAIRYVYPAPVLLMQPDGTVAVPCVQVGPTTYSAQIVLVVEGGKRVRFDVATATVRAAPGASEECVTFLGAETVLDIRDPTGKEWKYRAAMTSQPRTGLAINAQIEVK